MEILNRTIPADRPNRPGGYFAKSSITIHETDNTSKGADALAHAGYIASTKDKVSWHYSVDETRAVLHIPETEAAWHSGTTAGNQTSIGIEICVNSDGDFEQAKRNAAELVRDIMRRTGITDIKQHYNWNGKNCPKQLRKSGWTEFLAMCKGGDAMYTKILKPDEISRIKLIRAQNGKYESCESVKSRTGADIVFNGSAYNMTSYAIDGALTIDGTVYGTGRVGHGFALNGAKYAWSYLNQYTKYPDFIGGYGLLVHNGVKKLVNPLNDRDARTALGITANNHLIIMVIGENSPDMCSTDTLADKMLAAGAIHAINLDGGGSSQVIAPGHTIASTRDVNNYICIWLTAQATPTQPHTDTLTAKCTAKVNTLGSTGKAEYGRYIAKGDVCKIYSTITPNLLIKVDYPTSAGMRTAYVKGLDNFSKM